MNHSKQTGKQRVLIYPARTPEISGKQIYFLFTLGQIEDIIRELKIYSLPFTPSYIIGLAQWREQVVPVLSLEECLGLPQGMTSDKHNKSDKNKFETMRLILIHSGEKNIRGILSTHSSIRLIPRPDSCPCAESFSWVSQKNLVRGVYEWDEGFLVVVNINNILNGELNIKGGKLWNA